jgi:DNA polymerase III delta' subunit
MNFSSIIGQPLATDLAGRWLTQNTNQPLLFYGPEGTGKRTLALEIAKALNCKPATSVPPKNRPCGVCAACKRIASGQHPDVRTVDLAFQAAIREEALAKQQTLRIETILDERRRLFQSALEGPWKVLILDDAHRLTPDAANVLLKILEEPPPKTAIFLLTPFRDRLLGTVLSRCQPVRFKSLTDEEMGHCLAALQVPKDQQARLIELALGSPGKALHLNREEQIESLREAEELWETIPHEKRAAAMAHSEGRTKATRPTRTDIEVKVQALLLPAGRALRAGDPAAVSSITLIQNALTQLRQNVQPSLVYEYLLMQLTEKRRGSMSATL